MPARLLLIFVLLPFVDLASLAWLSWQTHWVIGMGMVLVAGMAGGYLVRWAGPRRIRATGERLAQGEAPPDELLDGVSIFLAGVLLISPGILSDAAALAILFPPIRRFLRARVSRSIRERIIRSVAAMAPWDHDHEFPGGAIVDAASRSQGVEEIDQWGRGAGRGI